MIVNLFTIKNDTYEAQEGNKVVTTTYNKYEKSMDLLNDRMNKKKSQSFEGIVSVGEQKMTETGYPTANVEYIPTTDMHDGFYYGKVDIDHEIFNCLIFLPKTKNIAEIYIFDFNKNIYGKKISVTPINFVAKLQDFDEISLKDQIKKNVELAKNYIEQ